jgi:hypothetical protein
MFRLEYPTEIPGGPCGPVGPCGPWGPVGPWGPWGPCAPCGPWGPLGPTWFQLILCSVDFHTVVLLTILMAPVVLLTQP